MAPSLDPQVREVLARALYEDPLWGSDSPDESVDPPGSPAWDSLTQGERTRMLGRADKLAAMLGTIGVAVVPAGQGGQVLEIGPAELELLAQEEHRRWMRMRGTDGWRRGRVKDSARKTHPSMIPYSELPESERDKDRERVLRFPQLLAQAGLGVHRS